MIKYYGPYFALKMYILLTDIFDEVWSKIFHIIHKPLMTKINTVVGIIISTTLINCPPRTIVDVCPNENVTFWLFNKNLVEPFQLKEDDVSSLSNAPFIYNTPIKILLHGYSGHRNHDPNPQIRPILDPAAPMFYTNKDFITMRCAKFIDAIHTNAGVYGKTLSVGHIDFYVDYLLFQRGCSVFDVSCNHLRAPIYFAESIETKVGFWGYPVKETDSAELMGEYTPEGAKGIYYLCTNSEPPYATGASFPSAVDNIKQNIAVFANKYIMGILHSIGLPDTAMTQVLINNTSGWI